MQSQTEQPAISPTSAAAGLRISPVKKLSQESEAWFEYGNGTPSASARNGGAAQQKQQGAVGPGRLNGSQNWYKHDDGRTGTGRTPPRDLNPIGVSQPKLRGKPLTEERKAREAAAGNPNDWFHHEHQADGSHNGTGREISSARSPRPSKKPSPTTMRESDDRTLWFAGVEPANNGSTSTPRSGDQTARSRHANPQADAYYKRDKTGSGADWFPHIRVTGDNSEPLTSATSPTTCSSPSKHRQCGSPGNRMNIESPEWFSHEDPPAPKSPRSVASPEVRKMKDRASGDEVRQILRVDENLEQRQQQHGGIGTSGGKSGSGSADVYTGSLVEKFQHQAVVTSQLE